MAGQEGALSIAVTNRADSDLADACAHTLELHAGEEISVAATKTFVTSAIAAVWLLAEWRQDTELLEGIRSLPRVLESAANMDWTTVAQEVTSKQSLFCLGRGPSFAISNEAALKFKETCQLHAESYSSAEVLHGPVSIVDRGFPVIALTAKDEAEDSLVQVVDQIADKGASVFVTSSKTAKATPLPVARSSHPLLDPISLIVSFYAMVEQVSRSRGINPDAPRHLKKVTETV